MVKDDRNTFLKWHQEKIDSNSVFEFQKEIENYCKSDVDIFQKSSLQLRQLLIEATGTDPFRYNFFKCVHGSIQIAFVFGLKKTGSFRRDKK